jgi:hypothetical protein
LLSSCARIDPASLADARDAFFGRRSMVRYIDRSLLPMILQHLITFQPPGKVDKDSLDSILNRRGKVSFVVNPKEALGKKEEISPLGITILQFPL